MENLADLLSNKNQHQLIWIVLLVIYILFDIKTPSGISDFVNSNVGLLVLLFLSGISFYYFTPVVGVLVLVALYELLKRSANDSLTSVVKKFVPSEFKKNNQMNAFNSFETTLEEEVVNRMVPLVKHAGAPNANYVPYMNDDLEGSPVN